MERGRYVVGMSYFYLLFKFLFRNCFVYRLLCFFCGSFQKVCDNKSETLFCFSEKRQLLVLKLFDFLLEILDNLLLHGDHVNKSRNSLFL